MIESIEEIVTRLETWCRQSADPLTEDIDILISSWRERGEALDQAEAVFSIVEPRSDKAEYLRVLGVVRRALDLPPVKQGIK